MRGDKEGEKGKTDARRRRRRGVTQATMAEVESARWEDGGVIVEKMR